MSSKQTFTLLQHGVAVLFLAGIILVGCGPTPIPTPIPTSTDTPTPTPPPPTDTPAPPSVTIVCEPDVSEVDVEVGQEVVCFVETEDQNVQFVWSALKGTVAPEDSVVVYTANTVGAEVITLEASKDGSTTVEHINFNVVPRPTDTHTPTSTSTPTPTPTPTSTPTPTPTPTPPVTFEGKVCKIREGQDTNAIFVQQAEFDALGLPVGTNVAVTIWQTGKTVYVPLNVDGGLRSCVVRLPGSFRNALGIAGDTDIDLEDRPIRSFYVRQASPPNGGSIYFWGKVCQIRSGWDTHTVFLRQPEFNAFAVPVGTTVDVTVIDTGKTVENVTLGLDSGMATCVVRLSERLRKDLGVADDTALELDKRPMRQFRIRLP